MDWHPIQGGEEILQVPSCHRNRSYAPAWWAAWPECRLNLFYHYPTRMWPWTQSHGQRKLIFSFIFLLFFWTFVHYQNWKILVGRTWFPRWISLSNKYDKWHRENILSSWQVWRGVSSRESSNSWKVLTSRGTNQMRVALPWVSNEKSRCFFICFEPKEI